MVIHKAEELVQEVNRLRTKSTNVETQLTGVEVDFRTCRDALDRSITEKEQLQRQVSVQLVDIDRLRQVWWLRFDLWLILKEPLIRKFNYTNVQKITTEIVNVALF